MLARLTIAEIAERTGLHPGTVKGHCLALYKRIEEKSAVGVVCQAYEAWIAEHLGGATADSAPALRDRRGTAEDGSEVPADPA